MEFTLQQLTEFLAKAVTETYAGGGKEIPPWNPGFKELEYPENGWEDPSVEFYYRDSYSGFYLAPGREVVYFKGVPIWCRVYFGGMEPEHKYDNFAKRTFIFLKKALLKIDPTKPYKRGPKYFKEGDWEYISEVKGDITKFQGEERIFHKGELVFHQRYGGCLILHR